ncbi:stimulated by retinoic acid gene 6 protein-like isoform X1 [Montipora capricornis]|uniref:stimulated by retinoic acid gene 6 protein-like isoform X1 n=1 Tax=Montipora capricornis TaxID=246305 RepID=UPI0035F11899
MLAAQVVGEIILITWTTYPELFIGNHTLGDVFAAVRNDTTILSIVANATGFTRDQIGYTIDLYLEVDQYLDVLAKEAATPSPNITNTSTVYICVEQMSQGYLTVLALIPAFLIILLLSCLNHRKRSLEVFGRTISRPGLCIPVNLVDSYENRFAFACAFGATTTKCLVILVGDGFHEIFPRAFNRWIESPEVPGYTGIVWKIVAMLTIGFSYYPLFACMATDYKITGFLIGAAYSALWLVITCARFYQCPSFRTAVFPGDNLLSELPIVLCLAFLFIKYLWLLVKAIYNRHRPSASPKDEENEWLTLYKYRYVVKLLEPVPKELRREESFTQRVRGKVYQWKPEFKYSTRVICTYFISFVGIYMILIEFLQLGVFSLQLRNYVDDISILILLAELVDPRQFLLIVAVSILVSAGISAVYAIALVGNMLSWYRGHLLRLQRGKKQFLPIDVFRRNPPSITVATLKYSGFQVAYLCWGTTIVVITLSVIGIVVGLELILPMVEGRFDSYLWTTIINYWPAFALSLIFYWFQLLLSKYVFLIDKGSTMALDNRRLFHVCTFFLFFFNIFLGLFSCLKRVIIGAVTGIIFLGRTQKSVLSRDFELQDPGFNAYVGYLLLEHTHANPVLVTFCQLLIKTTIDKQNHSPYESIGEMNHAKFDEESANVMNTFRMKSFQDRQSRKIRNRWHLCLTLHNNPSLKVDRRSELFVERSPLAAFGIMVQRGVMNLSNASAEERPESGAKDLHI